MSRQGWIVYNGNLNAEKFLYQVRWLERTGKELGFDMRSIKNNELIASIIDGVSVIKGKYEGSRPDFVFFWDKDIRLARHLEKMGFKLYNSASTIEICDDKSLTYQMLADHHIRMPRTLITPKVFDNCQIIDFSPYEYVVDELNFPLVIKEVFGSFGSQVYLIHNKEEMMSKIVELGSKPYVFQEFIETSFGRDIRLNVVGDRVAASMFRKSENDFRANVTAGGKMYNYTPTDSEVELAVRCSKLVGADFSGVDLLFGKDDEPVLCEINSNAHFKNIFDCTGIDVAKSMMQYIKDELDGIKHV
ncbi:RimK family alpha-L-glutamate ligase [Aneurinibacillus sp. Ricciae_BoGa-3]|uniref:ATP-grasp domain-containing protein n=1 Tax=Aneurinibacillus sp. Ricciae_BoGa-3 TaxID=3022697 RepID=UPI0023410DD0|nr:RimK family alpha-L-glutamate ligase [Aneurinibacillus sp. Ricciae_BoGa-3]WCK54062.1 RimK family alpha-L-glutamate ligase [Aneurinibacillus sp. Ricciae_BoGa-3]